MEKYKLLKGNEIFLEKKQLEKHIENLAKEQIIDKSSKKYSYPIPNLNEDFAYITKVYNLLNEHIKQGINVHPAGEWILDNYYIIEENVKAIRNELTLKEYKKLPGIESGAYKGISRIYILAIEIIKYTNNNIDKETLQNLLQIYQNNKNITMNEFWNIQNFLKIAIIENIAGICEKIYISQIQKNRAIEIIEQTIENKKIKTKYNITEKFETKYSFIEYMAYKLKKYGKEGYPYLKVLEQQVKKMGISLEEVIEKEHFSIAVSKVAIGNAINSIKNISRINFQEIFENINGVEEILKKDPAGIYEKMSCETKIYYRNKIKELAEKTKISEMYIIKKALKLAEKEKNNKKKTHIGYYLISKGKTELLESLGIQKQGLNNKQKLSIYVIAFFATTFLITYTTGIILAEKINIYVGIIFAIMLYIPISEIYLQVINYILLKNIKPTTIPKMNFNNGVTEENTTFVVIPTIIDSKEKAKSFVKKLEVYYLSNKSENIYFAILGDCKSKSEIKDKKDSEIVEAGKAEIKRLNEKYPSKYPKFHFLYRKRKWCATERTYLGWERKRGLLMQFNEFLLSYKENKNKNTSDFLYNSLEETYQNVFLETDIKLAENIKNEKKSEIPQIKYIITLDGDTKLTLNSGLELIGAMAHILNKPVIKNNIVVDGYGIIQPRIGLDLNNLKKSTFTQIFTQKGGVDVYTQAISDVYQDNFEEAIFTGKGIYDLETFNKVLSKNIPENTVLSHDLLEGSYLKCGLATDILLLDGYPNKYTSYMARIHRWTRGDWQIISWLFSKIDDENHEKIRNPLNQLSRFKIFENLRRSLLPIFTLALLFLNTKLTFILGTISILMPTILDILNYIVFRKETSVKQINFSQSISGIKQSILRGILDIILIPDKAYNSINAIVKTLYRLKTKNNLLEWTTAEEAEILQKTTLEAYYKKMCFSVIAGIIMILFFGYITIALGLTWMLSPYIMWYISKEKKQKSNLAEITEEDKDYIIEIARKTWDYFKTYLNAENHYLPPDNFQEDGKLARRTSSTNIGLGILTIVSAYDFKFIEKEECLDLLQKIFVTIENLQKWNGHLYNWYNTKTLETLTPRYISTVDSGNLVGYLYVVKQFLEKELEKGISNKKEEKFQTKEKSINREISNQKITNQKITNQEITNQEIIRELLKKTNELIQNTDFSILYNSEIRLFSIGFNIEENKLTDSYYDFLASESRQASLVAIAKKDVESKHWGALSRTLTILNGYKGLVSWSGTAFEYLMPNVNIKKYEGSLLDESCKFSIMSSEQYSKKFGVPWGISESAFSLKDLNGNYQYKAFGIPWLGLKRGLADDLVITPYASILAITEEPKKVIKNLKNLEKLGMLGKYGFYEAIDYTPTRLKYNQKYKLVKSYMAHHQGLILLSINNLINNNIIQKRFSENPEIEAIDILLQEQMPQNIIITKEKKEKIEKLKYIDYDDYAQRIYTKINPNFENTNIISNGSYSVFTNDRGEGYSKYKNIYINRYKQTKEEEQGIRFYIKNIKTKQIWGSILNNEINKLDIIFTESENKVKRTDANIQTTFKTTIAAEDNVEIRKIKLKNTSNINETLEISGVFEPILSTINEDNAHPAFNSLFLEFEKIGENIIIKRRKRESKKEDIFVGITIYSKKPSIGEMEIELDKSRLSGRNNLKTPQMIEESIPFSNRIGILVEPVVALRKTIEIEAEEKVEISLIIVISNKKQETLQLLEKYKNQEKIKRTFELARAKVEAGNRYLGITNKNIENYQQMISYLIYKNPTKKRLEKTITKRIYAQKELWQYGISGDIPILLVKIKSANDIDVLNEILKAYEYFKYKDIQVDLVILNQEENSYEQNLKSAIENAIYNKQISYLINNGIYILHNIEETNQEMLEVKANLIINAQDGNLNTILKEKREEYLETIQESTEGEKEILKEKPEEKIANAQLENLKYYNEYGGFSNDGKEFLIRINKNNKLPTVWSNVIANKKFGTLVTETSGGYTWNENSRLNRLTAWNNSQTVDIPSEIIYIKDKETGSIWTLGYSAVPVNTDYYITYGFGYAKYNQTNNGIYQENEIFVPREDSIKINKINLKNTKNETKSLKLIYYIKPVLGEDEIKSNNYIDTKYAKENNIVKIKNLSATEKIAYISASEKIIAYTGSKNAFIGKGDLNNPEALKKIKLDNKNGLFEESIVAIQIEIELQPFENKEIILMLGEEENYEEALKAKAKYEKIENAKIELEEVKKYWNNTLGKIQVKTPIESINIMLNGWVMYQTIASRMWGRTGYYQSGGAFGFRDQLQDTLGAKYIDEKIMKEQIIKSSKHQFKEGDVEHWWHEQNNSGIRTRFSDDLLWLPYIVAEYVKFTGDFSILEEKTEFVQGEILKEKEDEIYAEHLPTEEKATILEHCILSIEKGINLGKNGLIKIGSGDWNDGFSTVGNKGIGESVWLSFFVYDVLEKFIEILENISKIENEQKIKKYREIQNNLKKHLNQNAWDGRWFKRAYTDDGKTLGTINNEECKIDSIAQSWSIISNAADNDKKYIAFESLEKYLVDKENGILKLLTPAFNKSDLEPGYIKGYPRGIRENGGQYTHGSLWVIMAATMLGYGEKAIEYYKMLTPIEHTRTKAQADKYKVEPYVIPADVYGEGEQAGRGGWTWYTGSSSWYYKIGLENILGLKIENGNTIQLNPTIPSDWKEYKIRYKHKTDTIYNITIKNPKGKNTGIEKIKLNGIEIPDKVIHIQDNGKINDIEAEM